PPPPVQLTGIGNAAGGGGQGAPNTILSAFGSFPGCGASAQVTVNGASATVFFSSTGQVNFLMPDGVTAPATAVVWCGGVASLPMTLTMSPAAPGLFTANSGGAGQAALINQDGTIDTPSKTGTIVSVFGTGFGPLGPPGPDGL